MHLEIFLRPQIINGCPLITGCGPLHIPVELADDDDNTFVTLTNDYNLHDKTVTNNVAINISSECVNGSEITIRVRVRQDMECSDTTNLKVM